MKDRTFHIITIFLLTITVLIGAWGSIERKRGIEEIKRSIEERKRAIEEIKQAISELPDFTFDSSYRGVYTLPNFKIDRMGIVVTGEQEIFDSTGTFSTADLNFLYQSELEQ